STYGVGVVRELLGRADGRRLVGLVAEVAPVYGDAFDGPAEALARAHLALPPLAPALAGRLELLVARCARHEVLRGWHVRAPSFAAATHALLLRLATVRFLVTGLARRRGVDAPADLDALAIEAVHALARMLDGSRALDDEILAGLERTGTRL